MEEGQLRDLLPALKGFIVRKGVAHQAGGPVHGGFHQAAGQFQPIALAVAGPQFQGMAAKAGQGAIGFQGQGQAILGVGDAPDGIAAEGVGGQLAALLQRSGFRAGSSLQGIGKVMAEASSERPTYSEA